MLTADVDDLKEGRGAEYVDRSNVVLIFCSQGYFVSPNCMRECLRAIHDGKPLLTLLEPDRQHGSLSLEQIRQRLVDADKLYAKWGLEEEMHLWGFVKPTPSQMYDHLFGQNEPIEWNRLGCFQDVTMRLIAMRLLPVGHSPTYLKGELTRKVVEIPRPRDQFRHHLYVSHHNEGAIELVDELEYFFASQAGEEVTGSCSAASGLCRRSSPEAWPLPLHDDKKGSGAGGFQLSAVLIATRLLGKKRQRHVRACDPKVDTGPSAARPPRPRLSRLDTGTMLSMRHLTSHSTSARPRRRWVKGAAAVTTSTRLSHPTQLAKEGGRRQTTRRRWRTALGAFHAFGGCNAAKSVATTSTVSCEQPASEPTTTTGSEHTGTCSKEEASARASGALSERISMVAGRACRISMLPIFRGRTSAREAPRSVQVNEHIISRQLRVTQRCERLAKCERMLLYLNGLTWTSGERSAALAAEVAQALALGIPVQLAHEMPGVGQEERHGCEFGTFFACEQGATPGILLQSRIYGPIASPLKGSQWREASLVTLGLALAANVPARAPLSEAKQVELQRHNWIAEFITPGTDEEEEEPMEDDEWTAVPAPSASKQAAGSSFALTTDHRCSLGPSIRVGGRSPSLVGGLRVLPVSTSGLTAAQSPSSPTFPTSPDKRPSPASRSPSSLRQAPRLAPTITGTPSMLRIRSFGSSRSVIGGPPPRILPPNPMGLSPPARQAPSPPSRPAPEVHACQSALELVPKLEALLAQAPAPAPLPSCVTMDAAPAPALSSVRWASDVASMVEKRRSIRAREASAEPTHEGAHSVIVGSRMLPRMGCQSTSADPTAQPTSMASAHEGAPEARSTQQQLPMPMILHDTPIKSGEEGGGGVAMFPHQLNPPDIWEKHRGSIAAKACALQMISGE